VGLIEVPFSCSYHITPKPPLFYSLQVKFEMGQKERETLDVVVKSNFIAY
jgi:hypothetical protein